MVVGSAKMKINSIMLFLVLIVKLENCNSCLQSSKNCIFEMLCTNCIFIAVKVSILHISPSSLVVRCSDVCAGESMNGAAQVHVAGQIWSCLARPVFLWGLYAHNLWSEASNQPSHQPPPAPPSSSVNSSNLQSSCSSGTVVGVRDTSLHTVAKGRWDDV